MIQFKELWGVDFEFYDDKNGLPVPVCMCAKEFVTGEEIRLWLEDQINPCPDFVTRPGAIYIAYNASAEMSCHIALKWPFPSRILDLYPEFRNQTNGIRERRAKSRLLEALAWFGLDGMDEVEKKAFQDRIVQGPPYSDEEKPAILDYCMEDVQALENLLLPMMPKINLGQALLRGKFMQAIAQMTHPGIPIDTELENRFELNWERMKLHIIQDIDKDFGVYEGMRFKRDRWAQWLKNKGIPWPLTPKLGLPKIDEETFDAMVKIYPEIRPIKELKYMIDKLKWNELPISEDGRHRPFLNPFGSLTGRNQPKKSIFGAGSWIRALIKPPKGKFIAYIDFSQQEFGIAASFSNDQKMLEAYLSGDPYLEMAKQVNRVPMDATKASHPEERELYKTCILAQQYGMGAYSLARNMNTHPAVARRLIEEHKRTFSTYWRWIQNRVDIALMTRRIGTIFGWHYHLRRDFKTLTIQNFPLQANGAEILRLAIIYALEKGVQVIASLHDAILIMGDIDNKEVIIKTAENAMRQASKDILSNLTLRCDVDIVEYPNRYMDKRGVEIFNKVMGILEEVEASEYATNAG